MISKALILNLLVIAGLTLAGRQSHAQTSATVATKSRSSEFTCLGREAVDRLPKTVRLQATSPDAIELHAAYRVERSIEPVTLKRIDVVNQPKVAVFPIGGSVGISGEAKLLISKDALEFNEIGTVMVVNQTTRESVVYQCQKLSPSVATK